MNRFGRVLSIGVCMLGLGQLFAADTGIDAWRTDLIRQNGLVPVSSGLRVSVAEKKAVWTAFRKRFGDMRVQMGKTTCVATNAAERGFRQEFLLEDGIKGCAYISGLAARKYSVECVVWDGYSARQGATIDAADDFVFARLVASATGETHVWGAERLLDNDASVTLDMSGKTIGLPFESAFVYFIDDQPRSNWGHPARVVFANAALSTYCVLFIDEPATIRVQGQEVRIRKNSSLPHATSAVQNSQVRKLALTNGSATDYSALEDGLPENCYALIVSGGIDTYNNHIRYWNDAAFAYNVLSKRYSIPKANIKVLWASGDPNADICWNNHRSCGNGCRSGTRFEATNLDDLDGDGDGDIDGAASRKTVQEALSWYGENLAATDQLFIFITDHGGTYKSADDDEPATLCLWGRDSTGEPNGLKDTELAEMIKDIRCPIVVAMETCFSGGFCKKVVASGSNRLILTADRYHPSRAGYYDIDVWVYNFFSALCGYYPDWSSSVLNVKRLGNVCNADLNGDGRISFEEAHAFASKQNPFTYSAGCGADDIDEPQCQPANLASKFFLTQYADTIPPVYEQVCTPTLSPLATSSEKSAFAPYVVTVSCGTADATIRYTFDGKDPENGDPACEHGKNEIVITKDCELRVRAFKSDMDPSEVVCASYQVRKTAPEKSTIMSVSQADSSTAIIVNWLAGEGTDSFDVLRSESASMSSAATIVRGLSADTTMYADATAKRGRTYYYQVRANNAYGSTVSGVSFGAGLALNPPTDVKATVKVSKVKTASVEVSWTAAECASYYRVYRCGADGKTIAVSSWVAGTKYIDDTVPLTGASVSYAYYVESATDSSGRGESPMSEAATVEISPSTDGWSLLLSYVWWSSSECGDRAIKPGSHDDLCVRLKYADGSVAKCSECTHVTWSVIEGEGIELTPEDGSAWMERPPEVRIEVDEDAPEQIARIRATFEPTTGDPITRDVLLYISEDGILKSLGISSYEYLVPGESMQLTAIGTCYANARSRTIGDDVEVVWSIISGSGAIIDENGVLTALSSVEKDTSVVVQAQMLTDRGIVAGTRTIDIKCLTIGKQTVEIEPLGGEQTCYIPRANDPNEYKSVQYRYSPSGWLSGIGFTGGSSPTKPGGALVELGGRVSGNVSVSGYMFIKFTAERNPGKDREMLFKLRWSDGGVDYTIKQKEAPYADNPEIDVSNGLSAKSQSDGSVLHYATDGEEPTENSPILDGKVTFDRNTPVAVKAFGEWMQNSDTVYGDCEEPVDTVSISFDAVESGVKAPAARTYKVTDMFGELPTLTKKGLYFHGWTLYKGSAERVNEYDYVPSEDAVLYARWSSIPEDEPGWVALPWNFQSSMTGYIKVYDQTTQSWLDTAIVGVEDEDGECRGSSKNGFGDWQDERNGEDGLCVFGIYGNVETGAESGLKFRVWIPGKGYATVLSPDVGYMADEDLGTAEEPYVLNVLSVQIKSTVTFDANGGKGGPASAVATFGMALPEITIAPTRSSYVFAGYYDAKTGGTMYYDADLEPVARSWDREDAKVTLYARWVKAYVLTLKGTGVAAQYNGKEYLGSVSVLEGDSVTLTVSESYELKGVGYLFQCWTPSSTKYDLGEGYSASSAETTIVMPAAKLTMTANAVKESEAAWLTMYATAESVETEKTAVEPDESQFLWSTDGKVWYASGETALVKKGTHSVRWMSSSDVWAAPTAKTKVTLKAGDDYANEDDPAVFTFVKMASVSAVVFENGDWSESTAGGTVSMNPKDGKLVSGKSVALTAKPNKGYAFVGWSLMPDLDYCLQLCATDLTAKFADLPLEYLDEDDLKVHFKAVFRAREDYSEDDMRQLVGFVGLSEDLQRTAIPSYDDDEFAGSVELRAALGSKAYFNIGHGCSTLAFPLTFSLKGSLPKGLSLDKTYGIISGTPTVSGTFDFTVTAADPAGHAATLAVSLVVRSVYSAIAGEYRALMYDGDGIATGLFEMSVTDKGQVSGKIVTATGTTSVKPAVSWTEDEDDPDGDGTFEIAYLKNTGTEKSGSSVCLTADPIGGLVAYESVTWKNGETTASTVLSGELVRADTSWYKDADFAAAFLGKYYTIALNAEESDGADGYRTPTELMAPGYLTITTDKKGAVKVAGKLADGNKVSASTALLPSEDGASASVIIFVAPSIYKKQGLVALTLNFDADGSVSSSDGTWIMPPLMTAISGVDLGEMALQGKLALSANGTVYSALSDLADFYMSLTVSASDPVPTVEYSYVDDSRAKVYDYAEASNLPCDLGNDLLTGGKSGKITVAKSGTPWKQSDGTYNYEETKSGDEITNPAGLTISFKPATGIFSGSFKLYFDYETTKAQHKEVKCSYEGVLINDGSQAYGAGSAVYSGKYTYQYETSAGKAATKTYTQKYALPVSWSLDL